MSFSEEGLGLREERSHWRGKEDINVTKQNRGVSGHIQDGGGEQHSELREREREISFA